MILMPLIALDLNLSLYLRDHLFEHLKYGLLSLLPRCLLLLDRDLNGPDLFLRLLPDNQVALLPLLFLAPHDLLHLGEVVLEAALELLDLLIPHT